MLGRRRALRPLVAARHMLAHIESDLARDGDHDRAVRRLSVLLRRYLLARFPGAGPAALSGGRWARYVASVAHGAGRAEDDLETLLRSAVPAGCIGCCALCRVGARSPLHLHRPALGG
ncbi:MAG: DUF4381 domain-containing protein [Gammaproteobacteria bacterium]|nr:DUF4381 domain-containing protein [Gammaproteobacteria bacterium]